MPAASESECAARRPCESDESVVVGLTDEVSCRGLRLEYDLVLNRHTQAGVEDSVSFPGVVDICTTMSCRMRDWSDGHLNVVFDL